jgi:DNA polymerase-3 subunit alpha
VRSWPKKKEKLAKEKGTLGFYVSGHPLDKYRDELNCFATFRAAELQSAADGREVTVGGIIAAVKSMVDKKGNLMAFVTLEDFTGSVELILFSDCYEKSREATQVDRMVLVTGRVSTREGEAPKIICSDVAPLEELTERFDCQLVIKIDVDCSDKTLDKALAILKKFEGGTPVLLAARQNGSEVYIRSRKYTVKPDFRLLDRLKELLGESGAYLRPLK